MASGITVHKSSVDVFEKIKGKSVYKYAFFKIDFAEPGDKDKSVIPDYMEDPCPNANVSFDEDKKIWEKMTKQLTELASPRYVLYDFNHTPDDGSGAIHRLTFISWSPDNASNVKSKMMYASSRDYVQKAFTGINKYHQCNDVDALEFESILTTSGRKV